MNVDIDEGNMETRLEEAGMGMVIRRTAKNGNENRE